MKVAFVSGPYRAKTKLGILINILKARKVAKGLWKMGYMVVCPHLNSALMDGIVPDEVFLRCDLMLLKQCDVVVIMKGWRKSKGTLGEIACAKDNNIPVVPWCATGMIGWFANGENV